MKKIVCFLFFVHSVFGFGQQDRLLSGFGFTPFIYNPASYGVWHKFSANLTGSARLPAIKENIGFLNFTSEFRFDLNSKRLAFMNGPMTFGLNAFADCFVFSNIQQIEIPIAKSFQIGNTWLSFGISPGFRYVVFHWSQATGVPNLPPKDSQTKFDMGSGIMLFNDDFHLGISSTHLFEPQYEDLNFDMARHYYMTGGYKFKVGEYVIYPVAVLGMAETYFTAYQTMCYFQTKAETVSVGLGYQSGNSLSGGLALKCNRARIAYHLDYSFAPLSIYSNFTHEVRIGYMFK